jgi:adenylate cyclase
MYLLYKFTKEDIAEARDVFLRAIELDPTYSQTHSGLAYSHQLDILFAYSDSRKNSIEQLMKHARQGVALDDTDSYAHLMMAYAYRWAGQHDLAIAEAERAIELNPNDAWAIGVLGNVLDLAGRPQEGIPYLKQSLRLNPRAVRIYFIMTLVARAYLNNRDYQLAEEWAHRAINRGPNHARAHLVLASSLGHLGKLREASKALDDCHRVNPDFVSRWMQWREFRNDVDNDHILDGLRKAGLPE